MRHPFLMVAFVVVILLGGGRSSAIGDTYWQGGIGDWGFAGNWTHGEPTQADTAYIDNGGTAQITQAGEACYSLELAPHGASESGAVEFSSGAGGDDPYDRFGV